ncbi:MAG: hypothetical protein VYE77_05595 [Planctomycetota bacterium]|nr:hypothetical protein [Planctomycetota bacterium]
MAKHLTSFAVAVVGALVLSACARQEVVVVDEAPIGAQALFAGGAEFVAFERGHFADGEMGSVGGLRRAAPDHDPEAAAKLVAGLAESGWQPVSAPTLEGGVYPCGGSFLVLHLDDGRQVSMEVESWAGSGHVLFIGPAGERNWFVLDDAIRRAVFG